MLMSSSESPLALRPAEDPLYSRERKTAHKLRWQHAEPQRTCLQLRDDGAPEPCRGRLRPAALSPVECLHDAPSKVRVFGALGAGAAQGASGEDPQASGRPAERQTDVHEPPGLDEYVTVLGEFSFITQYCGEFVVTTFATTTTTCRTSRATILMASPVLK